MKTLIRWSLRLLALLFLLVLLTAALLWWSNRHDDDLLAQVKEAVRVRTVPIHGNGFFVTLAIDAPPGADAYKEGVDIYDRQVQSWLRPTHDQTPEPPPSPPSAAKWPRMDWQALRCPAVAPDCLAHYQAHAQAIEAGIAAHEHWLQRYLSLSDFPHYQPPYFPDSAADLSHYPKLTIGSELLVMRAALLLAGRSDAALKDAPQAMQQVLELLAHNARVHRTLIAGGHSMTSILSVQGAQMQQWRLLNALMRTYPQTLSSLHAAQPQASQALWDELLGPTDIDVKAALAYETQIHLRIVLDRPASDLLPRVFAFNPLQEFWLQMGAPGFLRRATLNDLWRALEPLQTLAGQAPHEWPTREQMRAQGLLKTPAPSPWTLRNFAGLYMLRAWSGETYIDYLERMHDADGFRRLLHLQWLALREGVRAADMPAWLQASPAELRDPYTQTPMEWDAASTSLGFTGRQRQIQNPDASHHYQSQIKVN